MWLFQTFVLTTPTVRYQQPQLQLHSSPRLRAKALQRLQGCSSKQGELLKNSPVNLLICLLISAELGV